MYSICRAYLRRGGFLSFLLRMRMCLGKRQKQLQLGLDHFKAAKKLSDLQDRRLASVLFLFDRKLSVQLLLIV